MRRLASSSQIVLSLLFVFVADACTDDEDPLTPEREVAGAAGKVIQSSGATNSHAGMPAGGTFVSTTSAPAAGTSAGITYGSMGGGVVSGTTAPAGGAMANGGVGGASSSVHYAGDGSIVLGGQGGTSATSLFGAAGLPVRRCRHDQDCAGFVSMGTVCFIPAFVNGCDEGPLGYCTAPGTPHCVLNIQWDPCGDCLMRPDGVNWRFSSSSRTASAATTDSSLRCSYCVDQGGGGASNPPAPTCADYMRYAAGNAGIAGCSAN